MSDHADQWLAENVKLRGLLAAVEKDDLEKLDAIQRVISAIGIGYANPGEDIGAAVARRVAEAEREDVTLLRGALTEAKDAFLGIALSAEDQEITGYVLDACGEQVEAIEGVLGKGGVGMNAIPLDQIKATSENPRKSFDDAQLAELTDSIRRLGVLQPILCRPVNDHLEIVAGERRYRAATAAGLTEIPAVVRNLTDKEAAEARIVENLHRADLLPLEEAEGFRVLHQVHKYSVDEIATKVTKSKAYVYARMKLAELPEKAKKALASGELSASIALLLARLPAEVAEVALPEMFRGIWTSNGGQEQVPVTFRQAQGIIVDRFARRLKAAPWDLTNGTLHGGACAACPKRTGAEPDLFHDLVPDRADVCTDVPCWKVKLDQWGKVQLAKAKAKGSKVLTPKEAKKVFPYGERPEGGYVDLRGECWEVSNSGRAPKWKSAIGGKVPPEDVVVAIDLEGNVRELMTRKRALALAKERGKDWAKDRAIPGSTSAADKKIKHQAKVRGAAAKAAMAELVEKAEGAQRWPTNVWGALIESAFREIWSDVSAQIERRRGWTEKRGYQGPHIDALTIAQKRGLLIEILTTRDCGGGTYATGFGKIFKTLCEAFEVDLKTHHTTARKALAPKKKPAKKKASAKRKVTKK